LMLHMHTCAAEDMVFGLSRHDWKNRLETVLSCVFEGYVRTEDIIGAAKALIASAAAGTVGC